MAESKIKMVHVLAEIDQYEEGGRLKTFSLNYIKTNGQKGYKPLVRKSGNGIKGGMREKFETAFYKINIKKSGLLLLVDHTNGQAFSLKISLLTHYNGHRIQH